MREITSLDPEEIQIGDRLRQSLNRDTVARLKESIKSIGLKTPISVQLVSEEEGWFLVAGRHRLQACLELGLEEIPVRVENASELDARMWEIAENLHRADLTALEHDEHIAEWIRLAEEKAQSLAQTAPVKSRRADGRGGSVGDGINSASRELGIERTQAQRAMKVASLPEEAKQAAREVGLDNNHSALLEASKSPDPVATIKERSARKAARKAHASDKRIDAFIRATKKLSDEEFTIAFDWIVAYHGKHRPRVINGGRA